MPDSGVLSWRGLASNRWYDRGANRASRYQALAGQQLRRPRWSYVVLALSSSLSLRAEGRDSSGRHGVPASPCR